MAIPLPNPNINDFDINDVQTWSSNKLKEGFEAVGATINNDGSIEAAKLRFLTYKGTNTATNEIDFGDITPLVILSIDGYGSGGNNVMLETFRYGNSYALGSYKGVGVTHSMISCDLSYDGNKMTITGSNAGTALNYLDSDYTVTYIG